jgi:hypothetical protein
VEINYAHLDFTLKLDGLHGASGAFEIIKSTALDEEMKLVSFEKNLFVKYLKTIENFSILYPKS